MGIKLQVGHSQHVVDQMRMQGFVIEQEFEGVLPKMPADITDLDDEGVMRLWQEYNAYLQFVLAQVTCANIDETDAKKTLEYIEAKYTDELAQPKMTVSAIKAKVSAVPSVQDAESAYNSAYYYRKGMEMLYTNIKMDCDFISRELTRRTSGGFSRASKFTI